MWEMLTVIDERGALDPLQRSQRSLTAHEHPATIPLRRYWLPEATPIWH
jgi:hypothetical protein